jgi:hypothetical protein
MVYLALMAPDPALCEWPVTEFQVFLGEPWSSNNTLELEFGRAVEDARCQYWSFGNILKIWSMTR